MIVFGFFYSKIVPAFKTTTKKTEKGHRNACNKTSHVYTYSLGQIYISPMRGKHCQGPGVFGDRRNGTFETNK